MGDAPSRWGRSQGELTHRGARHSRSEDACRRGEEAYSCRGEAHVRGGNPHFSRGEAHLRRGEAYSRCGERYCRRGKRYLRSAEAHSCRGEAHLACAGAHPFHVAAHSMRWEAHRHDSGTHVKHYTTTAYDIEPGQHSCDLAPKPTAYRISLQPSACSWFGGQGWPPQLSRNSQRFQHASRHFRTQFADDVRQPRITDQVLGFVRIL